MTQTIGEGWTRRIDLYCERVDWTLWGEPLNFLSNGAFIVAAVIMTRAALASPRWSDKALVALVYAIGVGSALHHSFAQAWAGLADVTPIVLFSLLAVYLGAVRLLRMHWALGLAAAAMVIALQPAVAPLRDYIRGVAHYLPMFAALTIIGAAYWRTDRRVGYAAGAFAVSMTAAWADAPMCAAAPVGTHWLWHGLNALTLGLVMTALIGAKTPVNSGHEKNLETP